MKTYKLPFIFILLLIGVAPHLMAQQVPNSSFEQWEMDSKTGTLEPVGWDTKNIALYGDTNVRKSYSPKTGNLACGLKTNFIANVIVLPGILHTTFAITQRPSTLTGYIKGNLALDDTSLVYVTVKKDTTVIGEGFFYTTQSLNNYIKFIVPINYTGQEDPDSCTILVLGGTGSTMDDTASFSVVDDFALTYPSTGIATVKSKTNLTIYPNPTSGLLTVSSDRIYQSIAVYTTTGQKIKTFQPSESIDVSDLVAGLYFIVLLDDNGNVLGRTGFSRN
ncbi:MAG: T9SS type A sorting domain-containing protein [Bacteroidota bacterium]